MAFDLERAAECRKKADQQQVYIDNILDMLYRVLEVHAAVAGACRRWSR
jgi:hypothetical protein